MKKEKEVIRISVRNLVEFLFRSGDIMPGGTGIRNPEAMQLGSKIHRKIQKSMGLGYQAEVSLFTIQKFRSIEFEEDFFLKVEGRADGILREEGEVTIDEIKGVYLDVQQMKEPVCVHTAQAMCYAYIIAEQENLSQIHVQMTYCNMETEKIRRFKETYTREEIRDWFMDLMRKYEKWAVYEYDWKKKRNASIRHLTFPFSYRPGQKDLMALTYKTIEEKKRLLIQAPTGTGKTITTIFPAVMAMGEEQVDRIFYLTAKTITRTVAQECFSILLRQDLTAKPITITAKEKMCVLDSISCNPADCPRARGHFDRINEAVYDLIANERELTREVILQYAKKHEVCPFEMSLDAATYADAVICDYNYVFDPNVYLRRFFSDEKQGNMVLLIDEAHNLVERGRQMYSACLVKEDFMAVKRIVQAVRRHEKRPEVQYNMRKFERSLESANRTMLEWKRECDEFSTLTEIGNFEFQLLRVMANDEQFFADEPSLSKEDSDIIQNLYFEIRKFCMVLEWIGESYQICLDYNQENEFRITLQCMNPAERLREVMGRGRSAILFSATLLPIRYYKEQLTGDPQDMAVYAQSSFLPEQRKILIARDVTTRYTRRNSDEYEKIARYIEAFVSARKGNYLVFFPSYSFLDEVIVRLRVTEGQRLLVQESNMKERDKEDFLSAFDTDAKESVVGCCVMGGIFSEGIDLKEDRLIGAVIVGTGLPMVCREREFFKDYYDRINGRGFDYSYLYPGINKVFQAGGRVIRTVNDRGAILLLDERFLQRQYLDLFPREWYPYEVVNLEKMKQSLHRFWEGSELKV